MSSFTPVYIANPGEMDLIISALKSDNSSILEAVLSQSLDTIQNYRNNRGETLLHVIIKDVNPIALEIFLNLTKDSLDINAGNSSSDTALHKAAYDSSPEIIELLLKAGADPNLPNKNGRTPAHNAAYKGRADVLNLFLNHGVDLNLTTNNKKDVVKEASSHGLIFKDGAFISKGGSSSNQEGASKDFVLTLLNEFKTLDDELKIISGELKRIIEEQARLAQAQNEICEYLKKTNLNQ